MHHLLSGNTTRRIANKTEFRDLSKQGKLGNYLRDWPTVAEMEQADYEGFLTIRSVEKQSPYFVPVAHTHPDRGVEHYSDELLRIQERGGPDHTQFYYQEIPNPGLRRIANIEAGFPITGLVLHMEQDTNNPLRGLVDRSCMLSGLHAVGRLHSVLRQSSLDTLYGIWEEYPEATIEASEFSRPVGVQKQHLVVWEVRHY